MPTGDSFNLVGTAIYLTMASLFSASALGDPLSIGEEFSLLVFMIIASKGAAGVTGAGLATLAGGLASHRPDLVDGVGLIVGIDRFMSEARALTNFAGNSVATVLIGTWTGGVDRTQLDAVLAGVSSSIVVSSNGSSPATGRTSPCRWRPNPDSANLPAPVTSSVGGGGRARPAGRVRVRRWRRRGRG